MSEEHEAPSVAWAYDRWASSYDTDSNRTRDLDATVLRSSGPDVNGLDVLELGCGTGKNTSWLAERARSVIGLDASAGMLAVARQRVSAPSVRFLEHDIRIQWPIPSSSVDVVIVDLVLEHIERLDHVFGEAARVLRPAGALFVCELHPVRQMLGGRAHFTDEARGETVHVPVVQHTVSEFINAGVDAGLRVGRVGEWWDEQPAAPRNENGRVPPRLLSVTFSKR